MSESHKAQMVLANKIEGAAGYRVTTNIRPVAGERTRFYVSIKVGNLYVGWAHSIYGGVEGEVDQAWFHYVDVEDSEAINEAIGEGIFPEKEEYDEELGQ